MRYLIIVVFLGLAVACESKVNYQKPEDLLTKKEMVDLLYDMHIAVGAVNMKNVHLEKNRNYMTLVLAKHGVDSVQFKNSNIYYTSNINEYEEIFEEVQRRIEELQNVYREEKDSIIKAVRAGKLPEKDIKN